MRKVRGTLIGQKLYKKLLTGEVILDGRTILAKTLRLKINAYVSSLADNPSTQERAIIRRAAFKELFLESEEAKMLTNGNQMSGYYIALANSLRLDLIALGLKRRAKDIIDLPSALARLNAEGIGKDKR